MALFLQGWLRSLAILTALLLGLQFAHAADERDVEFISHGVTLSGSLVFPDAGAPLATLVIVDGSGKLPRNLSFARQLASDGFAVFAYDKRGVGRSAGEYWGTEKGRENIAAANLNLLADDVDAAAALLMKEPRLHGVPLGLIGVSQAGWIIPIAATRSPLVEFIVLWSGPVSRVSEQLAFQNVPENNSALRQQIAEYIQSVRGTDRDVDPRINLSRLSIPGLWIFGGRDVLAPVNLSISRLDGLIRNGHPNFEYKIFPDYGHSAWGG